MRGRKVTLIYIGTVCILIAVLFLVYIKKEEKRREFGFLPEFSFTEVDGYKNSTKNLPQYENYVIFLFNPGCEACVTEAKTVTDFFEFFEDSYLMFLSPDSLSRIEQFMKSNQLYIKENVLFGHINPDTIEIKFGQSIIPWSFIYDRNGKLINSRIVLTVADINKFFSKNE